MIASVRPARLATVVVALLGLGLVQIVRVEARVPTFAVAAATRTAQPVTGSRTAGPPARVATTLSPGTTPPMPRMPAATNTASAASGHTLAGIPAAPAPAPPPAQAIVAPAAPVVFPAPTAPATGHYTYTWNLNQHSRTQIMTVAAARSPTGAVTVNETGSPVGMGSDQVQTWSQGKAVVLSSSSTGPTCGWEPPVPIFVGPLHPGQVWNVASGCSETLPNGGGPATLAWRESDRVAGVARTKVGGRPVVVWVIERHQLLTETNRSASITTETAASDLLAPALGLIVYEVSRTAYPNANGSIAYLTSIASLEDPGPS